MRIWDLSPGYLNDQSLLGEHRELHGIASILRHGKRGYSRHPETLRWKAYGWALHQRHGLLRAEMALRGFCEQTPVRLRTARGHWPNEFLDTPAGQYLLLANKYRHRPCGRIPLPRTSQELWAQHKYSVMARDPQRYRLLGRRVAGLQRRQGFDDLAMELTEALRLAPSAGRLHNALQHMWGHVAEHAPFGRRAFNRSSPRRRLTVIQRLAVLHREPYLLSSTALSELSAWL